MSGKRHYQDSNAMPSLTIQGKRLIIANAIKKVGEKAFLDWLNEKGIPSIRYVNEHVRKYKAKFFRDMHNLG